MVVEHPWANGAGKRTILKAIPSVLRPDEGSIFFEQNTGTFCIFNSPQSEFLSIAVADTEQSAVAFGAKVSLKQPIGKSVYLGEYYVYTDSRANEDVYSYIENTLGIYLGVTWTRAFFSEVGYEYSHGDSFRSILTATTTVSRGRGRGKQRQFSSTFGNEVIKEKVDRHGIGATAGIELAPSLFTNFSYTYSTLKGDLGTSIDHTGFISLT